MNAKKAKHIRKIISKKMDKDWREANYVDSNHPREKIHSKEYQHHLTEWTNKGVRNITKYVPIKVSTKVLSGCGKKIYRHYKEVGSRI